MPRELRVRVGERVGSVSALFSAPSEARALLVLAHGAGAGMRHAFLETACRCLADEGIATFRFQFPYTEKGRRAPDPPPVLTATLRAAVETAAREAPELPLLAGGKSLGGRMASTAAAERPLPGVRGIAFFGFPLHTPGKPDSKRAAHLADVALPMLFLQGTRDELAELALLEPVIGRLGPRARLHRVEGADHSFRVPKRTGRGEEEVHRELAAVVADWSKPLV